MIINGHAILLLMNLIRLPLSLFVALAGFSALRMHSGPLQPDHCAFALISTAPESVVGISLFVFGSLAIGWACVAAWVGQHMATRNFVHEMLDKVLFLALFGYLSSLILFSIEVAVSA